MATLVLSTVGSAVGSYFGPLGAAVGRSVGAIAGSLIDQSLFGGEGKVVEGPRLEELSVTTSSEGHAVLRIYGRARVGTELIWALPLEEQVSVEEQGGGKGGGGGSQKTTVRTYSYFASFALGICEGELASIGRIWADSELLDQSQVTIRFYPGSADQAVDPLIEAEEGIDQAPAYRHLAYLVFERLPLADYGNRIPQINVEVTRQSDGLAKDITGVCLIPGSGEFVYDTMPVRREISQGEWESENVHQSKAETNFIASMEDLLAACPNLTKVSLVVGWFGTDLRLDYCQIRPGVERQEKETLGGTWKVAGQERSSAYIVTTLDDRPAYGGTPSDATVIRGIAWLKGKGIEVTIYPFILMDVAPGNAFEDPYGGAEQGAYPWRGQITISPAPGRAGSPDGSAAVTNAVASFFGTASAAQFSTSEQAVAFSGSDNTSFRHFILHYAQLAAAAGGVDQFLIGSEMPGLTRLRGAGGDYPATPALKALAADARAILGAGTRISYAADWTEYGAYRPPGTTGHVDFPLDDLWSDPNIDFLGIDYYPPLADWRYGSGPDEGLGGPYDPDYLVSNIEGGEGFDWYYASEADRLTGTRTPIADPGGRAWVDRQKDLRSFILETHNPQRNGVDQAATSWVPGSKSFRFTEFGVAAVDLGANRPSTFYDPKSSVSGLPPFSIGRRDDCGQAIAISTILKYWREEEAKSLSAGQPVIVLSEETHLWAWDARPYPAFPEQNMVWSDAGNWLRGHWLNGRLGLQSASSLVQQILADFELPLVEDLLLSACLSGYIIDRPMSARAALTPLGELFDFSFGEREDGFYVGPRQGVGLKAEITQSHIALDEQSSFLTRERNDVEDLPGQVALHFAREDGDYLAASVIAKQLDRPINRDASARLSVVMSIDQARTEAEAWLDRLWRRREQVQFQLPLTSLALEPGDRVTLTLDDDQVLDLHLREIEDGVMRKVRAERIETGTKMPALFVHEPEGSSEAPVSQGPAVALFVDLPALDQSSNSSMRHVLAAAVSPWPGSLSVFRSNDGAAFIYHTTVTVSATLGRTSDELAGGASWRWQRNASFDVTLVSGVLESVSEAEVLNGANLALVGSQSLGFELIQFETAELIAAKTYRLTKLLRGQGGTEALAEISKPIGSEFILLDDKVLDLGLSLDDLDREIIWRLAPPGVSLQDDRTAKVTSRPEARALIPWSPVHLAAEREPGGVNIHWIRRSRQGGDSWALGEVPLIDQPESYALEILNGAGAVLASYSAAEANYFLSNSDEIDLFGSVQSQLTLRLRQVSATLGAGDKLEETIHVRQYA